MNNKKEEANKNKKKKEEAAVSVAVLSPTAGSAYSYGWGMMKKFFLDLFLISLIVGVVWLPLAMVQGLDGRGTAGGAILQIFAFIYLLLLIHPIDYGAAFVFLKAARNEQFEVSDMFLAFQNYMNVVLAALLKGAIVGIGMMFFVVPGIIFACKLAFVKYLVMDRKMDPVEAVKESWKMTTGYSGHIFVIGLLAFLLAIAGLICFGVGIIPVIIWVRSTFASMYYAVCKIEEEKA
ncbi:MAG: hypothetical protein OEY25_03190 [Candidatus Aminicenantes bacterium]|nr:hypothetical protein [Candidatus Aminicenantes bacterium]MDH5704830.1 hypothetical protein [Candidatus Aminicenantes bacterium]